MWFMVLWILVVLAASIRDYKISNPVRDDERRIDIHSRISSGFSIMIERLFLGPSPG